MSEDINVIVEAAVQRIKREISDEMKNLNRHLEDSELNFEVKQICVEIKFECYFHSQLFFV